MNKLNLLLLISCLCFPIGIVMAQQVDEDQLKGLQYRNIGPQRGGRVTAVTGVPDELFTFYMGATGGGVWKTTDGGLNWSNISDAYFKAGSIGAIAVAPSDKNVIYVGTGSADPRGNVSAGIGMYRSTDAGDSWTFIGLPNAGQISRIRVHPNEPNNVYVAVLGNVFGPSPDRGVYHSVDGGLTWEKILYVSERTGAIDLVMDPNNPRVLYAGMWTAERKPWTFIDGSEEGGVWKTTDGGEEWKKLEGGLPDGIVGRVGVAVSPQNSRHIWVLQEAKEESKGGLYFSSDGGKEFKRINRDHELRQRAWYYTRIYADPRDANTVFVVNAGFHKSIDGGKTFLRISTPHGDNHDLWINPHHPDVMIEANDGGACVTFNGGKTWTTQLNQPTAEFYRVTVDNQFPYRVYGAQQDNTTISVPSRFQARLTPEQEWYTVGGGESGHIAVDPRNPSLIYAGNYIGQITRTDRDRWHRKDVVAYPQMHDGTAPRDIVYRFQWNAPIRISPHNPDVVYHCSQYVHRTTDGGQNWEVISPDLTTNKDEYHDIPGEPVQHDHTGVELYTTIFAFEENPKVAGELWAGTDDGRLHISRDNGESWQEITPPNIPKEGTINSIDLSPHQPGRAFIAVYKYRENDFRPYLFMTNNYGKNWKLLTTSGAGIPDRHFVRVVREDPIRKGLLFAGTEFGMYLSFDEGKRWQPFQLNLPVVPITDMLIKDNDLVLATQGRSFWILDDISPLRTFTETIARNKAHLFRPQKAYRTQFGNFRAAAPDRAPNGALLYFYLQDTEEEVRISILDGQKESRVVYATQPDAKKKEKKLSIHKGINRLEWDLKYEGPTVQPNSYFSLANTGGLKAPPGEHTIVLKVGDERFEQPLTLDKDPRWTQTNEDLRAQYQLGAQAKALLERCHEAIGEIRALRDQIRRVEKMLGDYNFSPDVYASKAKAVINKLTDLEKTLIQTQSESGQDPFNYPPMLDDQIAYLYSIVNGQDDRPTAGAYKRYEDLKALLDKELEQLIAIQDNDIKALNQIIAKTGLKVIQAKK